MRVGSSGRAAGIIEGGIAMSAVAPDNPRTPHSLAIPGDSNLKISLSRAGLVLALCILPAAHAAKKPVPLSEADAAALQGKTAAVTQHKPASFIAMTAGKAGFGLLGVAGMVKAGNDFVAENGIEDPSVLLRTQLGMLLQNQYGLQVQPVDTTVTEEKKSAKIARLHPESDVILSVRTHGWNYGYYAANWGEYWIGWSAEVQLIDSKSGKAFAQTFCGANTQGSPIHPKLEDLRADRAQLTKDVLNHLGWLCVQLLAKDFLRVPEDKIPAMPAEYLNPLARLQPGAAATTPPPAASAEPTPDPTTGETPAAEPPAEPAPATPTP
jgi:hypothetical protein